MRFGMLGLVAAGLMAQTARFEVAVIRPSGAAPDSGTSFNTFEGGRIKIINEPVRLLVRVAFGLQNSQIAGGPAWLDTDRYDLEAKTGRPEKPRPGEISPMMQDLLRDRFHLQVHREPRETSVYALVAAKGGTRLTPSADGEVSGMKTGSSNGGTTSVATATSLDLLATYVGNRLGRIVVNETGLKGAYDFTLTWASDQAPDAQSPPLVTALREQLGLRLEPGKRPVEVLVIDRIDRPSAN